MKTKLVLGMIVIIISVGLMGCGQNTDDAFLKSMAQGLESRWTIVDADLANKDLVTTQRTYLGYVNAELDQIAKYKTLDFEDATLGEKAKEYIAILEKAKKTLDYYEKNPDQFVTEWSAASNERSIIIYEIYQKYGLEISEKHQSTLDSFITEAKLTIALNKIVYGAEFKKISDEYDWVKYAAVLETTTDTSFDNFEIDLNLVDAEGVVISSESVTSENWSSGGKNRFEIETDEKFAKFEIVGWSFW